MSQSVLSFYSSKVKPRGCANTALKIDLPPIELGSEGITTCSGWFSSSLKFGSSTLTAIGDSVVRFEGPGLGELRLLGRRGWGKAGEIVVVTGFGVRFLLIFLVVNTGLLLLVFTFLASDGADSTLEFSGGTLLNSEYGLMVSHRPCTFSVSADCRKDCSRPRSTWTWKWLICTYYGFKWIKLRSHKAKKI